MLFPVRCWTCGKVVGHLWEEFNETVKMWKLACEPCITDGLEPLFDTLGVERFCCRTLFISYYDKYEDAVNIGFPDEIY